MDVGKLEVGLAESQNHRAHLQLYYVLDLSAYPRKRIAKKYFSKQIGPANLILAHYFYSMS